MVDALSAILPEAAIGHLNVQRDPETQRPVYLFEKLPADIDQQQVIITDPMLATGGSACQNAHPDIPIIAAALNRQLDKNYYILPCLGDAGDRIYNRF